MSTPDPQSSPWLGARDPALDTIGTGRAVLTPEEVLLTWCHCAEKAVRCHSCLWLTQAPLLFFCGFRDPWHVLNREHAACHVGEKMEKPSTRHAFTYQLFRWPQVTTRSGFIEEKKLQRQISHLRMDQMLSDLLAWQVWLERTYSLSAVLVTGAGLRRLTIYTPSRPQRPTPSRTSVVLWLFGRRAEPSHNPKGTSFKTRLFPALHVPSLESLGHMPRDVITAEKL